MKIGVVGPIWHNLPPAGYGGTELVVYNLVNALSKDNDVYLFGPKTAKVKAHLIPTADKPLRQAGLPWTEVATPLRHIAMAFDMVDKFDILHVQLNTVQDFYALPLAIHSKTPVLFTPHFLLPDKEGYVERAKIFDQYKFLPFSSISDSQRKGSKLNFIGTVYNGIDISKFKFNEKPDNYFVWMGKLVHWKGAREAIMAAKKAKVKLYLIGPVDDSRDSSIEYFNDEINPLLNDKDIIWKGELGFKEKAKILSKAKALISPISWEEPFGMVTVESMALGTPVISFARGATKEIIQNGKNGYLVKNISEMVKRMGEVEKIDRREARKRAEEFSDTRMAKGYVEVYSEVIKNWNNYLKNNKI